MSNYDDIKNPYYAGGGAQAIHEVVKRLANKYDVVVYTGDYPGAEDKMTDNVAYRRIGFPYFGPKVGQLMFQLILPFYVHSQKFDVWIESFTPPFSTGFLQLFTTKPVVGLTHMLCSEDMERKYKLPFGFIERLGLKHYRHVIALTDSIKVQLLRKNPKIKVCVIPNAPNENIQLRQKKKQKYVLFLGRLEVDQKGIDLLLKSYASIATQVDVKLVIAGSGEKKEEEKVSKLIKLLHLENKIVQTGRVGFDEKVRLLSEAICIVIPSRYEAFSITALEALYAGVPMVAFDIEGLKWVPENACVKIQDFDTAALGKAIVNVLRDAKLRSMLIRNGKEVANRYKWRPIAKQYDDVIKTVLINEVN